MTPLEFTLLTFGVSILAGVFGALLGLGGGIIVVPLLTLGFGIDIRHAVGASLVSIIATSSGAAAAYVRDRLTNLRVAMLLEIATTSGAITGALIAGFFNTRWLYLIFGIVLAWSAIAMMQKRRERVTDVTHDRLAARLRLSGGYFDAARGKEITYKVEHTRLALALMYLAGILSALLGIGSGILKVPTMDLAMRLPIKVSSATSNFMIGVTAAASAAYFFSRGYVNPFITAPVAAGIVIGATLGSRLLGRMKSSRIRAIFLVVLIWVSFEMIRKAFAP
ncbi:sulfite exporter TauE/SafE family protein [bacterium]|nr:sulfite exporter TauE/SafE family protein [bacterium]